MFEDLDLNVGEEKVDTKVSTQYYTYTIYCTGPTSRRVCSETSTKYCC